MVDTFTLGPWFATDVEYPDGNEAMTQGEPGHWTVSTDPLVAGWHHDGGYDGYGVSEANARQMDYGELPIPPEPPFLRVIHLSERVHVPHSFV